MRRRDLLLFLNAYLLSALFSSCNSRQKKENQAGKGRSPNVLFISIDDLNSWVGFLKGHPQTRTPNLDRLAAKGLAFEYAYCNIPLCSPSRTAVLSGIQPYNSGVYDNDHNVSMFMSKTISLPKLFKQNGYWVGGCGKIFHGGFESNDWDVYSNYGRIFPADFLWNQTPDAPKNQPVNGITGLSYPWVDWNPLPDTKLEATDDAKVVKWVSNKLLKGVREPFFLGCGVFSPHLPWYVPQKYFDAFPLDTIQLPEIDENDLDDVPSIGQEISGKEEYLNILKSGQYREAIQGYLASIYYADDMFGRVLDALESSLYANNTVIIFWSDNGFHLGEKLKFGKASLWEEATRIPLIINVPKGTKAVPQGTLSGERCSRVVSLVDLYPTLVELCQLSSPPDLDGRSLVELLRDPSAKWNYPAISTWRDNLSVRSERFRLIRYEDGSEELYDHSIDPHEWNNLASDPSYYSVKAELANWLPTTMAPRIPNE